MIQNEKMKIHRKSSIPDSFSKPNISLPNQNINVLSHYIHSIHKNHLKPKKKPSHPITIPVFFSSRWEGGGKQHEFHHKIHVPLNHFQPIFSTCQISLVFLSRVPTYRTIEIEQFANTLRNALCHLFRHSSAQTRLHVSRVIDLVSVFPRPRLFTCRLLFRKYSFNMLPYTLYIRVCSRYNRSKHRCVQCSESWRLVNYHLSLNRHPYRYKQRRRVPQQLSVLELYFSQYKFHEYRVPIPLGSYIFELKLSLISHHIRLGVHITHNLNMTISDITERGRRSKIRLLYNYSYLRLHAYFQD